MSRLQILRDACGDDAVRLLISNGLEDLDEAKRLLFESLSPPSLSAYRHFLHHLDNTAGELDLIALRDAIAGERLRVVTEGGTPDSRLEALIASSVLELRALAAP
jgi:hypothetical protein